MVGASFDCMAEFTGEFMWLYGWNALLCVVVYTA